ncbi:MAG TPA: hypothetical protein VF662_14990 [Allosphingosinicella sp.]|jgi:nucleoside phosphorylase
MTVIEVEFNSALAAFGVNQREATIKWIFGHPFVRIETLTRDAGELIVWVCMIGVARNLPCTNFCRDVFEQFDVRYGCILVGIAAGHPDKLRRGDVVGARLIYDIEGERVEEEGGSPRLVPYPMQPPWDETFRGFNPHRWDWLAARTSALEVLSKSGSPAPAVARARHPKYRDGIVLAGEKLRRDNPLPQLSTRFGDEIVALEMEGSGFAAACRRKQIPWFVFRGVSDHGTRRKGDTWQPVAALNAAIAARSFIENWLYRPDDGGKEIPL